MWDSEQSQRLAMEEKLVNHYMPGYRFYDRTGNTYIEGEARTNGHSHGYRLRIELPPDYPYERPDLFVVQPRVLRMYGGRGTINALGGTHSFHTGGAGPNGCVQICHTGDWDASMTCVKVLIKGHLWLEAYDAHLRTGRDIADFLR